MLRILSNIEDGAFCENKQHLNVANYFRKTLLTGFQMRLCVSTLKRNREGHLLKYVRNISRKTNISYHLIRTCTRMCISGGKKCYFFEQLCVCAK